MDIWRRMNVRRGRWESGRGADHPGRSRTQVVDDFDEGILDGSLGLSYIHDVGLQAPNPPSTMKDAREKRGGDKTHSKPASPVREASRLGFSKRHSRDCWRHRLQGGFSAPSHRIFCFLQAFYGGSLEVRARARRVRVLENSRKHLGRKAFGVSGRKEGRERGDWDERGTLFKVLLTGLMSFPPGPPLSSMASSFLTS
jgi:hypothetical protein